MMTWKTLEKNNLVLWIKKNSSKEAKQLLNLHIIEKPERGEWEIVNMKILNNGVIFDDLDSNRCFQFYFTIKYKCMV